MTSTAHLADSCRFVSPYCSSVLLKVSCCSEFVCRQGQSDCVPSVTPARYAVHNTRQAVWSMEPINATPVWWVTPLSAELRCISICVYIWYCELGKQSLKWYPHCESGLVPCHVTLQMYCLSLVQLFWTVTGHKGSGKLFSVLGSRVVQAMG